MPPIEALLSADRLEGALAVILVWILLTSIDHLFQRILDKKVFSTIYSRAVKKAKSAWTRHKNISSQFEFTAYVQPELTVSEARKKLDEILRYIEAQSRNDIRIEDRRWDKNEKDVAITIQYQDEKEPYCLNFVFVPDSAELGADGVNNIDETPISSIGISIEFQFAFARLRNSIINLGAFAGFVQGGLKDIFPVKNITKARFVVSSLDNDLTLDEWIQKEQFDVSLLLESDDGKRSVEFFGDRAVVTSPHERIDDETVEYIRATLLNYYL